MSTLESARRLVALRGNAWRNRFVDYADRDTPATRRAVAHAADQLSDAIAGMLDAVYDREHGRRP